MKKLNKISLFIVTMFFFIISVLLYIFSPDTYSLAYCNILFIIYLASSFLIIRHSILGKNYFNFHLLFLISFFFVNFVYPVSIYPISPYYFRVYRFEFDPNVITKATALALIASCSYNIGVALQIGKKESPNSFTTTNFLTLQSLLIPLLYILFLSLFLYGGTNLLRLHFGSTFNLPPGLLLLFQVCLGLSVIIAFYTKSYTGSILNLFKNFNKAILLILFLFCLLFIVTGDRGPLIQIVLITVVSFTIFVRPMKLRSFVILVLAGMLFLTFISYARTQTNQTESESGISLGKGVKSMKLNSFYDIGMDLIINNRNLYTGYEYVAKNGISYGKSMYHQIFSPVPKLPSLFTQLVFKADPVDLSTATILTKEFNAHYGLGTNMVIDLYMNFGILGVIIFMLILGIIATKFQREAYNGKNFNYLIAYAFLVGLSIYMPRSTIFDPIRPIVWGILLFQFIKLLRLLMLQLSIKDRI
jgi:oligosaccharide repeat unit polymerase